MRKIIKSIIILSVSAISCINAHAQVNGGYMEYKVEGKDTVFVDLLREAKIYAKLPKQKGKKWRQYYRLVYNFNKVYPYALVGRKMMAQVDSTIAQDELKRSRKDRYVKDVEIELFTKFEDDIRNMTVSQGKVLMKLVDRECGMCPYDIIREYLNGMAAGFWQGVAKVFGADLKKRYDPAGEDSPIEELVQIWDSGDWEEFYYAVFWEYPKKTVIKSDVIESESTKKKSGKRARNGKKS